MAGTNDRYKLDKESIMTNIPYCKESQEHYALFNYFEIRLTLGDALSGSHSGRCDSDVADLLEKPYIARQLDKIPDSLLIAELSEYGAWNDTELSDRQENNARIIWIAAGNIRENKES